MSTAQSIKRSRALSSACRTVQSSRLIHSSSVNHASLAPSSLVGDEPEEIILQPIFDIFDAPSTLAESSQYIRNKYAASSSAASTSSTPSYSQGASSTSSSFKPPAPLPQPTVFDGPARPTNGVLAFQSRMRDSGLRSPKRLQSGVAPSNTRTFSSSEPLVQMFDGPARITRYHHQSSGSRGNESNSTKYMVAVGVAGAVAYASLVENTEETANSRRS